MLSSSLRKQSARPAALPGKRKGPDFFSRVWSSQTLKGYLYISPWLIGFLVFGLWPIVQTFYYSFTRFDLFNDPVWIGLKNYQDILTRDPIFLQASVNMITYVMCSTAISIGGG